MKQQQATLEKRNAPRNKSGDAVGRPSCRSSLLGDPGAKFLVETGDPNRTVKNSLNYVSTCLRVVDTRRFGGKNALHRIHGEHSDIVNKVGSANRTSAKIAERPSLHALASAPKSVC